MDLNEKARIRLERSFAKQGFMALIGAELNHVEVGKVTLSCMYRRSLTQQNGLMHAGVVSALADVACGYAALSTMPENMDVLSVEFKINMLRPAKADVIVASGRVVKSGRTLIVSEAEVTDSTRGVLIAKMLATMIVSPSGEKKIR